MGRMKDKWIDETFGVTQNQVRDHEASAPVEAGRPRFQHVEFAIQDAKEVPSWEDFKQKMTEFPFTDRQGNIDHEACFGLLVEYARRAIEVRWPLIRSIHDLQSEVNFQQRRIEVMARDLTTQILSKEAKSATAKPKRPGRPKTNRS